MPFTVQGLGPLPSPCPLHGSTLGLSTGTTGARAGLRNHGFPRVSPDVPAGPDLSSQAAWAGGPVPSLSSRDVSRLISPVRLDAVRFRKVLSF